MSISTIQQSWLRILCRSLLPRPSPKNVTQRQVLACCVFQTGFRNNHKRWDCQTKLDFDVKGEIWELPCLLKKNKAVEQATVKVSRPQALKFILLVFAPVVPPFKRKWARSDCGFSEHFTPIRSKGSACVAGDICSFSSSTWFGPSPLAHAPLSEINMCKNSQTRYRLLLFLCDVYASHKLACGLETRVIKNNHRSVQLWELPELYILPECRKRWMTETMQKSLQKTCLGALHWLFS